MNKKLDFKKGMTGHIELILNNTLKAQINHIIPAEQAANELKSLKQEFLQKEHFVAASEQNDNGWFDAIIVSDKYTWSGRLCLQEQMQTA